MKGRPLTSKTKAQEFKIIDPPITGEQDDPRQVAYVPVSVIHVDPNVQRATTETRLDSMGEVDWALLEGLTLTVRADGTVVATEGQHRVLLLQRERPDAHVWAVLNPGENNEAAIALAIAKSRRAHTPFDKWQLALHDRELLQVRGEQVLAELGLRLYPGGNTGDPTAIGAVGAVERVMRMRGTDLEGIEDGADVLRQTLSALVTAFPGESARTDGALITAVGRLFARNENIRPLRMAQTLRLMPATKWLQKGLDRLPSQSKPAAIGKAMIDAYNKQLGTKNEIRW